MHYIILYFSLEPRLDYLSQIVVLGMIINAFVLSSRTAPVEAPSRNVPVAAGGSNSSRHAPQPQTPTQVLPGSSETAGAVGGHSAPAADSASPHDDAVLREKLKHMGKSKHYVFNI